LHPGVGAAEFAVHVYVDVPSDHAALIEDPPMQRRVSTFELTQQSMDAVMASQMEQMPQLKPYESIMKTFLKEQMDWSILEPEFTRIYAEVFTEKELRDMTAIYQTPVGQMMLAKMPGLLAKSNEFTQKRLQAGLPILMQRLEAAMKEKSAAPAPAEH